jgi:hypothetical protein
MAEPLRSANASAANTSAPVAKKASHTTNGVLQGELTPVAARV